MTPVRTCVGCGRRAAKAELLRFAVAAGALTPDPAQRAPGRGAYVCRDRACLARALARRGLQRTLRTSVETPDALRRLFEELVPE